MDTLQRKKIALENSLRANGNANPSYFSVTQVSFHLIALKWLVKYVWRALTPALCSSELPFYSLAKMQNIIITHYLIYIRVYLQVQ